MLKIISVRSLAELAAQAYLDHVNSAPNGTTPTSISEEKPTFKQQVQRRPREETKS